MGRIDPGQGLDIPNGDSHARRISEQRPMSKHLLVVANYEDLLGMLRTLRSGL